MSPLEPVGDRPRLLVTAEDFDRADGLVGSDERARQWFETIQERADAVLSEPPIEYDIADGKRLLAVSRTVLQRTLDLATCYRLTGEERYLQRLWRDLDAVAGFPDWNPSHFLDVGEMTAALAVGYDWCHADWSAEQRERIADGIVELGLEAGRPAYEEDPADRPDHLWWVDADNNWNSVCNGGLSLGALALLGEGRDEALLETILAGARESIRHPIENIGTNGGWEEGINYWAYNARYLTYYCSSLLGTLGSDDGLCERPAVVALGDFPVYMTGPTDRVFSFGDSEETELVCDPALQWLAHQFDRPDYARLQWRSLELGAGGRHDGAPEATDLLWYDPSFADDGAGAGGSTGADGAPALDRHFPGGDHVVTFRSSWAEDGAFLGFKGGDNRIGHGDLDVGTFVFDDRGVRWASDVGDYDYAAVEPAYWNSGPEGSRWQFYRKRAEGHNTLVLDPDEGPDQDPTATCPVETVDTTPDSATAIVDASTAYPTAERVERGIRLERPGAGSGGDGSVRVTVRDEIHANSADVWWFLHTRADVASVDGSEATLRADGEECTVAIASPTDATFEVREAAPLPSSPQPDVDDPIEGVRKLAIHLPDVSETAVTVRLGQDVDGSEPPTSIAEWRED